MIIRPQQQRLAKNMSEEEQRRPSASEREEQTGQIRDGSNSGTKISDEENDYLNDIFYDPRSPVAFSGFQRIYQFLKDEEKEIKPKKLKVWLSKQEAYTSHFPAGRKFQRPRVLAFSKNYQWDTDTANMNRYRDYNDGYGYFVVFLRAFQ